MVNYNCEKCSFTTYLKTDYLRHLNKKRPCDAVKVDKSKTSNYIDNSYNVTNIINDIPYNHNTSNNDDINILKNDILFLKSEISNLYKIVNQQQQQINQLLNASPQAKKPKIVPSPELQPVHQPVHQPVPAPQPVPVPAPEKKQEPVVVYKKNKAELLKESQFKDAITMNEFISNIRIDYSTLNKIYEAQGRENAVKFSNGISEIFLDNFKKLDEAKRPIFCSDLSRKKIHFNQIKYTLKKEVCERMSKFDAKRQGFNLEVVEDEETGEARFKDTSLGFDEDTGEVLLYKDVRVFEKDTEWLNYDNTTNYDDFVYFINELSKKAIKVFNERNAESIKISSIDKDCFKELKLLTTSVKENIGKIVSRICDELYVE